MTTPPRGDGSHPPVGPGLEASIGVGKRVRVPFGRGDMAIVGYCVGVTNTAPAGHRIKPVVRRRDGRGHHR